VSVSNRVQGNEDDVAADTEDLVAAALEQILALDQHHEACLLSHVSRRSSKAQGVAMLTLFSRGLSRPFDTAAPFNPSRSLDATRADVPNGTTPTTLDTGPDGDDEETRQTRENMAREIIDGYKRLVRKGTAPGHLAVCWGAMSSALGLSQGETAPPGFCLLFAFSSYSVIVR
jgi:urease accessory protein